MALWKKLWIVFTVVWVVVASLNIGTIIAFSEGDDDSSKALAPLAFALVVPTVLYALGWAWARWRARGDRALTRNSNSGSEH